ncbi:MAG: aldo/keto reductase [Ignavibacteriales bacterium]|nr:aldo/keto reductase [Ignavibacteriales bacterium]
MLYKNFAKTNIQVSQLGYGCWGIGKSMWIGAEDSESKKALHKAIEEGINLFDTALVYGDGHSEKLVGEVEKESGKDLFIASKIPSKKFEWPAKDSSLLKDSFPIDHIISSTEHSLKNLKRDYVNLMQFHVWNDKWTTQDEWKEAIYKLKKDGKVQYFGISINDHQPWNGIEAGKTGLIDCFQVIFNLFDQSPTDELFTFCEENKISILARVPFDEGSLTGTINENTIFPKGDWRNGYFKGDRKKEVAERVAKIWEFVNGETESIAEAALRYIVSFSAVTSVIPGMRSEKNLLANKASVEKGALSNELLEKLKSARWIRNFYE